MLANHHIGSVEELDLLGQAYEVLVDHLYRFSDLIKEPGQLNADAAELKASRDDRRWFCHAEAARVEIWECMVAPPCGLLFEK